MWRRFPEKNQQLNWTKKAKKKKDFAISVKHFSQSLCNQAWNRWTLSLVISHMWKNVCLCDNLLVFLFKPVTTKWFKLTLPCCSTYLWQLLYGNIKVMRLFSIQSWANQVIFEAKEIKLKYFKMLENVKSLLNPLCCAKKERTWAWAFKF